MSITTITRPSNVLERITAELWCSLEPDKKELLELVGISEFLCCLSVLNRERVAGRISTSQKAAARVGSLLGALGLHCHRSVLDLLPQPDLIGGHVKHHAAYVAQGSRDDAWAILYFAVDEEFARGAEAAELNKAQRLVGQLFGYPDCCSEFFLREDGVNQDRTPRTIHDAGPFPSILNPVLAELYGLSMQFHFACSPRCPQSLEIARGRLKSLERYAPSVAKLESLGAGITLYGPSLGAALATRYREAEPGTYEIEEVVTWSDKASAVFAGNGGPARLRLQSAHYFELKGRNYSDSLHFAALFSESATPQAARAEVSA